MTGGRDGTGVRDVLHKGALFGRYVRALPRFLAAPMSAADARTRITSQLAQRESTFIELLDLAVFRHQRSPYLPLFRHVGAELGDVKRLIEDGGVEGALASLHDAGVAMRLEEFKGRVPVERPGLSYLVEPQSFDNPLLRPVFQARTVGSSGVPRTVQMDLAATEHEAAYQWLFQEAFGAMDMPQALWRPVPPGTAGLGAALAVNKLGLPVAAWFSQTWPSSGPRSAAERAMLEYTRAASNRRGAGIRVLEHVPLDEPERVARWLADTAAEGRPAMLNAPASSAVRVGRAALAAGLDLGGTLVRTGGEPLTEAKAEAITSAGARVSCNYAMSESGRVGVGCADPRTLDDVHVLSDKIGMLLRPVDATGTDAMWLTSLHLACRKVMINVDVGDHGIVEERRCGCLADDLGLRLHLHGIRSHDKLTSEGMTFLGSDLETLVEQVLPSTFGGSVGDYQLVESEVDGLPSLSIIASPALGRLDEDLVVRTVLDALGRGPSYKQMMASILRDGGSLRVERRAPHATGTAKVPALHRRR